MLQPLFTQESKKKVCPITTDKFELRWVILNKLSSIEVMNWTFFQVLQLNGINILNVFAFHYWIKVDLIALLLQRPVGEGPWELCKQIESGRTV